MTPSPIEVLRAHRPEVGDYEAEFDAALAAVEKLVVAAQGVVLEWPNSEFEAALRPFTES
jgi:hypothetical protein